MSPDWVYEVVNGVNPLSFPTTLYCCAKLHVIIILHWAFSHALFMRRHLGRRVLDRLSWPLDVPSSGMSAQHSVLCDQLATIEGVYETSPFSPFLPLMVDKCAPAVQAVAIYDAKTGAMQSITAISAFFTPPTTSGTFVFDPRCAHCRRSLSNPVNPYLPQHL